MGVSLSICTQKVTNVILSVILIIFLCYVLVSSEYSL